MSTIDEGASITAQNSLSDNDTRENKHSGKVESGRYHNATLMQSTNSSQSSEWPIAVTSLEKLDAPTLRQNLEFAIGRMESMTKLTTEKCCEVEKLKGDIAKMRKALKRTIKQAEHSQKQVAHL